MHASADDQKKVPFKNTKVVRKKVEEEEKGHVHRPLPAKKGFVAAGVKGGKEEKEEEMWEAKAMDRELLFRPCLALSRRS